MLDRGWHLPRDKCRKNRIPRVSSPVQLSKLQRLLRHGLLMMKTAAEANRTGDEDGANDQDTHGFSPR
jgi:hypothetical protein